MIKDHTLGFFYDMVNKSNGSTLRDRTTVYCIYNMFLMWVHCLELKKMKNRLFVDLLIKQSK